MTTHFTAILAGLLALFFSLTDGADTGKKRPPIPDSSVAAVNVR